MSNKLKTAFTLVELLVVIAIVGILSGLIIVGMSSSVNSARIAKAQIFSASLRDSLLNSLISEWKFDELTTGFYSGTVKDTWGANDGTYNAGTGDTNDKTASGSSCIYGKCIYFDGTDDYINFGNNSNLNTTANFSISLWIKTAQVPAAEKVILWKENSSPWKYIGLLLQTNGRIQFRLWDSTNNPSVTSLSAINDGKWHYVVAVRSSGTMYMYLDTISSSAADSTSGITTDQSLYIGNGYGGAGSANPFNGYIDDVRIFNTAIPTSQIKERYFTGIKRILANGMITKTEYQNKL